MIIVDTTVLVYAVGTDHVLRQPCRDLVQAILDRRVEATSTVEVIQELVHVRGRRRGRPDAADLGRDCADLLAPLLTVSYEDLMDGMAIYARNRRLGAFDSVLAAAATRHGASAIVSADRGFSSGIDVRHVVPDAKGIATLLA